MNSICTTPSSFGPTVAIVDAGSYSNGSGTVEESLQNYDTNYGLPACTAANGCLSIVNQQGAAAPLPANVSSGWSDEIVLDVEAVHMICQHCKILLVETNDNSYANLTQGMLIAQTFNPVAISMSFYSNFFDATMYDADFSVPGIALVAATGDASRSVLAWPADNPGVLAVSGTTLQLNTDNTRAGETVWSSSGGACAQNYLAPAWQTSLSNWSSTTCGAQRAFGDLSADGDPNTGMYINLATGPSTSTWLEYGGTSLATPIIAAMLGIIGRVPAGTIESSIPYSSNTSANFLDIISGNNCTGGGQTDCTARAGYDSPSGLGSPIGLGGLSPPPAQPTGLAITQTTHTSASLNWSAGSSNVAVSNYTIYRDGIQVGSTASTSYTDPTAAVNNHYAYSVKARDILNNVSPLSATATADTYYSEDVNEDGHINLLDLSLLAGEYGQSGPALGRSDMNADGNVNLLDLSLLAGSYGTE
ncbi:MAG TPA: dockerin type I domain-containing protein [Candidatus Saccharimonadales bacterium]|nr:dockerin type I domain-containing protein [Candidatus Saccharimonadales bacterium]